MLSSLGSVSAYESDTYSFEKAQSVMKNYIEISQWNDFEINNAEKIYDGNYTEYGYVFELSDTMNKGYGIVVETNGNYFVAEASIECESPYLGYDDYYNIYSSQLNYYFSPNIYGRNTTIIDAETYEEVSLSDLTNVRVEVDSYVNLSKATPGQTTTKYVSKYGLIETIEQPSTGSCIAYSTAMMLKYLHNVGKIKLSSEVVGISDLATTLFDYMENTDTTNKHGISDESARNGIKSFGADFANKSLSFESAYSKATFTTAKAEIDSNYPVVLMFDEGILYDETHATTMYGYKIVQSELANGSLLTTNYAIVKDPGGKGSITKELAWTSSSIYGYFILYVG